jgi:hypothetical protein
VVVTAGGAPPPASPPPCAPARSRSRPPAGPHALPLRTAHPEPPAGGPPENLSGHLARSAADIEALMARGDARRAALGN